MLGTVVRGGTSVKVWGMRPFLPAFFILMWLQEPDLHRRRFWERSVQLFLVNLLRAVPGLLSAGDLA